MRRQPPADLALGGFADAGDGSCRSSACDGFGGQCREASAFCLPSTPIASPAFARRASGCPPLASPVKRQSSAEQALPSIPSMPRLKDPEVSVIPDVTTTPKTKPSLAGRGSPSPLQMPSLVEPELPGRPEGVVVAASSLGWHVYWKPCLCDPVATKVRIDLVGPNQLERRLDVGCADDLCAFIPRSSIQEGEWSARVSFGNQSGFGPHSKLVHLPFLAESSQQPAKRPLSAPGLSRQPAAIIEKRPAAVQEKHPSAAVASSAAPRCAPLAAPRGRPPIDRQHPMRASSARQLRHPNAPSGPSESPRPARPFQTPPPGERRSSERRHTPPTPPSTASTPSPAAKAPSRQRVAPRVSRSCPGSPELKEERELKIEFLELALAYAK